MPKSNGRSSTGAEESLAPDEEGAESSSKPPVARFTLPGSANSTVEIAIWENEIDLPDRGTAVVHAATFSRSFKQGPNWSRTRSFRLHDLLALQHGIGQAIDYLLQHRPGRQEVTSD
jgi:hypothetical protein